MDTKVIVDHAKKLTDRVSTILAQSNAKALLGAGFCFGILASSLIMGFPSRPSTNKVEEKHPASNSAWMLAVTLKFKNTKYKDNFMDLFQPLAKFVEENESETLSYMLSESDKVSAFWLVGFHCYFVLYLN